MSTLTRADQLLFNLTNALTRGTQLAELEKLNFQVKEDKICVVCGDRYLAAEAYQVAEDLLENKQFSGISIEVWGGRTLYGVAPAALFLMEYPFHQRTSAPMIQATCTTTVPNWQMRLDGEKVFDLIDPRNCAFVYSTNRDRGYPVLAVRPSFSSSRLNRPLDQLLKDGGMPVRSLDYPIAVSRERAIERAIETKQTVSESYEFIWAGTRWRFVNQAQVIDDSAVLVQVIDSQNWQTGFWESAVA